MVFSVAVSQGLSYLLQRSYRSLCDLSRCLRFGCRRAGAFLTLRSPCCRFLFPVWRPKSPCFTPSPKVSSSFPFFTGAIRIPLFGFSSFFQSMIFSRTCFFFLRFISFFYSWRRRGMTFFPTYIFSSIFQGQLHHQFSLFHHLSIELRNHQECQMAQPSEDFPPQDDHHGIKYAEKLTEDALPKHLHRP